MDFFFFPFREREKRKKKKKMKKKGGFSLSLLISLPRADDAGHRAVVRDLQRRRVGERGGLLQQPRAGARRRVLSFYVTRNIAAGRQKALERRGGGVEHPAARGHELDRGLPLPPPFGPAGDEEVVPPGKERRARDVGGVPADGAGGGEGLERGAVGGVDVAVFFWIFGV